MNSSLCLFAVAGALACGLSFARPAQDPSDPLERVEALEKELAALKSEVAAMRKTPATATGATLDTLKSDLDELVRWVKAQGESADALQRALDESRAKGFTSGINPDSRTVLLGGLGDMVKALKSPLKLSADQPKPALINTPRQPAKQ